MNKTSIPIAPSQAPAPPDPVARVRKPAGPAKRFLLVLASLRLTIVLFALSLVLVFFGTMAQMDEGLLAVLTGYFRGFIAWWMARTYHMAQIPGFARKVRAVLDWTVSLPFQRDLAEVGSIGHPRPLRDEAYQHGGSHRPLE